MPDNTFFHQSTCLHVSFFYLQIQVHRPFLTKKSLLSLPSLAICSASARSCVHVLEVALTRGLRPFPVTFVSNYLTQNNLHLTDICVRWLHLPLLWSCYWTIGYSSARILNMSQSRRRSFWGYVVFLWKNARSAGMLLEDWCRLYLAFTGRAYSSFLQWHVGWDGWSSWPPNTFWSETSPRLWIWI